VAHTGKSEVNTKVMKKLWKACAEESATNVEVEKMWKKMWNLNECLETATEAWQSCPFLTEARESTCAIWQAMLAKDAFRTSLAHTQSLYKIMELVGRFTAQDQWSAACALICYKTSEELRSEPFPEQYNILDELYERITRTRVEDEELHDVMVFWGKLDEYRERMLQSSEEQLVTTQQASEMLDAFKYDHLWDELTWQQQQSKRWRSTLNTILHRRAGWTHAAKAIMEYGLPKLEKPAQPDDATGHIGAPGQSARDITKWLQEFASSMHAYRQTDEYQKKYQTSIEALEKRKGNA
jgi:hypothetical protein